MNAREAPLAERAGAPDAADYDALVRGAGVYRTPSRIVVRTVGDDRVSFLHGMCSGDVKGATAGTVIPALFLTEHAHLIADFFAWVADDAILLDIDSPLWMRAREHLERLLVADDVEFEESAPLSVICVFGPRAADAIRAVAGEQAASLAEWRHLNLGDLVIGNVPRLGAGAFAVLAPSANAARVSAQIAAATPGAREVGEAAVETVRIENGIVRAGIDTTASTIALEARLEGAISFRKGCYVGQETIERATAHGALKKRLFGLRFDGRRLPACGAEVMLAGKAVGRATSVALSPRFGPIGLSILHHSAWNPGTRVEVEASGGAITAQVSEIPFR
ncbi:MAG TPA: glycine cleavage T C-terminal barrel domain-containing protein [Candidatus Binataceae bacterium]|nr:glycine cleavage T C-terminal barrel domain-containing protein [Candidatus Binataceae bacterium]